ncbi:hypothetical protein [Chitinophaga vietnamensis]|uniref:hypothetical protein n=1 Tax=Chitinophaga vietnamensis TaxID=2593957 RepID=UPI001177D72F|nr:hypothetical protein [Chitinophaga vietnamensis]
MVYFTEEQQRVLKTAWIPILPALLLNVVAFLFPRESMVGMSLRTINYSVMSILLLSWELGVRRGPAKGLALLGISSLTVFVLTWLPLYLGFSSIINVGGLQIPLRTSFLMIIAARYFLVNTTHKWPLILIGTAILMFMPEAVWQIYFILAPFPGSADTPLAIPSGLYTIVYAFQLYTALFFLENYLNIPGYINKLRSKIQVLGKAEFALLSLVMLFIIMGAMLMLNYAINGCYLILFRKGTDVFFGQKVPLVLINAAVSACWLVLAAYFLRNVVVARSLTIHIANDLFYVLHYIPGLNIIALIISLCSPERSQSIEENAMIYLYSRKTAAKVVTFIVAILAALARCAFVMNAGYGYLNGYMIGLAIVLSLASLCFLALGTSFKAFIYILVGFNVFVILLIRNYSGIFQGVFLFATYAYMLFYFLMETFHAELSGEDALAAPLANRVPA